MICLHNKAKKRIFPKGVVTLYYQVEWNASCSVVSDSLQPRELYSPWNSPGQNTGVGSLSLLQGIFPTQGSNPDLSHCRQILYQLSHQGNPWTLEWVAYPFSSGSSRPGIEPRSPALQADSLPAELSGKLFYYQNFPQLSIPHLSFIERAIIKEGS